MVEASTDADMPLLHPTISAPPLHDPNIAHRKVNLLDCHGNEAAGLVRRLGSGSAHLPTCVSLLDGVGVRPNALCHFCAIAVSSIAF